MCNAIPTLSSPVNPSNRVTSPHGTLHRRRGLLIQGAKVRNECVKIPLPGVTGKNAIHGHSRVGKTTATYTCWQNMLARCRNPKIHNYKNYGGRGIRVCDRWANSFINFLSDMGEQPAGMSIERLNNDKNYCPENCIWLDKSKQCQHQTSNRLLTFNGITDTMAGWSRKLGFKKGKLKVRIDKLGWSVEKSLTKP